MLVIPIGNRVNWHRPPVITLLLIAINCAVFFFLQTDDEKADKAAAEYYLRSDLPQIEWPRYADYLKAHGETRKLDEFNQARQREEWRGMAVFLVERDWPFLRELHAGRIVTRDDADFDDWVEARGGFETRLKPSFTDLHIFKADNPTLSDSFVSAFMHGGFDHLLGNMAVLFLVGVAVETVLGKSLYLLAYLASIFASDYAYLLLQAEPGASVLGASGAVSGVMGLYTLVFGLRRIDFFYSLLFYFDYVRGPAILLLPVWLGNELYQFYIEHAGGVAFMAHFGGLVCGAAMGGLYRWLRPAQIESGHQHAERPQLDRQLYQKGLDYLGAMEFKKAADVFKTLRRDHPDDPNLAWQFYRAAKYEPAGEDFHHAARHLMLLPAAHAGTDQLHEVYLEYLALAKPAPRIGGELSIRLARAFASSGHSEDAEKLLAHLLKRSPGHEELPDLLLVLARGYFREGDTDKQRAVLQLLMQKYPEASAANVAEKLLGMR